MRAALIGGTGTLGRCLLARLAAGNELTVYSRGEHAQKDLRERYPGVRFVVGDVRDPDALAAAVSSCDTVFHLAAMKHVDVAQANPAEAIKTNVLGAMNVAQACAAARVATLVYSNTDKAVLPITTYGYTKALAQDLLMSYADRFRVVCCTWGNVAGSQGSVIPLIAKRLRSGQPVQVTDRRMTRFWLRMEDAAAFMLDRVADGSPSGAYIPPVKGAALMRVVGAVARVLGSPGHAVEFTGLRGVEKLHECLYTSHEHCLRSDTCEQYTDDELDELVRPFVGVAPC